MSTTTIPPPLNSATFSSFAGRRQLLAHIEARLSYLQQQALQAQYQPADIESMLDSHCHFMTDQIATTPLALAIPVGPTVPDRAQNILITCNSVPRLLVTGPSSLAAPQTGHHRLISEIDNRLSYVFQQSLQMYHSFRANWNCEAHMQPLIDAANGQVEAYCHSLIALIAVTPLPSSDDQQATDDQLVINNNNNNNNTSQGSESGDHSNEYQETNGPNQENQELQQQQQQQNYESPTYQLDDSENKDQQQQQPNEDHVMLDDQPNQHHHSPRTPNVPRHFQMQNAQTQAPSLNFIGHEVTIDGDSKPLSHFIAIKREEELGAIPAWYKKCATCGKSFSPEYLPIHRYHHLPRSQWPYYCKWVSCNYRGAQHSQIFQHVRLKHFGLPDSVKKQRDLGIEDDRDAKEFVGKI